MLSDANLRSAARKAQKEKKAFKKYDTSGLYVRVGKTGRVKWKFRYHFDVEERGETFGTYPATSLAKARKIRDKWLKILDKGKDPRVVLAEKQREKTRREKDTFSALAEDWIAAGCPGGKEKRLDPVTVEQLQRRYEIHLKPSLGDVPIASITRKELKDVLIDIQASGTLETAHRVKSVARRIFDYAIEEERAEINPATARITLQAVKRKHFAAITKEKDIGPLLRAIDGYEGAKAVWFALRLAPYVFLRPGELRGALWCEIDWDRGDWRIPPKRMKKDREHIVPLSRQVLAILKELHEETGDCAWLFPGLRSEDRPISDNTLNAALRRMGFSKDEMTAHGFRSMASTRLHEMRQDDRRLFDSDVIEFQLAHLDSNATRAAYNRFDPYKYIIARRRMMQRWADYLDRLKADKKATVTAIRG